MIRWLLLFVATLAITPLWAQGGPQLSTSRAGDKHFSTVFDMYWRARLLERYAGNRVCSLPNNAFDDPKSPYRPIAGRLHVAEQQVEKRFPTLLNKTPRPYQMPPPQSLCEDTNAAWQAIFAYDTAVTALETMLTNLEERK